MNVILYIYFFYSFQDFSTRSLKVSEESPIQMLERQIMDDEETEEGENVIQLYQMRRTWESR